MVRNVGGAVSFHFGGAHVPRRKYRRTPAEHCRGRCPHRPAVRPECFFQLRRGRRPRRPAIGETAPTFQSISGSGAEGETILNLGYGLPNPPLADRKRKSRNLGFLRAFGHFSRAGKVTRRRQNRPIQLPIPPKTGRCGHRPLQRGSGSFFQITQRAPCAPPRSAGKLLPTSVGGDAHIAPPGAGHAASHAGAARKAVTPQPSKSAPRGRPSR